MVDAVHLLRIFLQVEEFPLRLLGVIDGPKLAQRIGIVVDQLVALGAHAVVGIDAVVGQMHPVAIVERRLPVIGQMALDQRAEALALHGILARHAGSRRRPGRGMWAQSQR